MESGSNVNQIDAETAIRLPVPLVDLRGWVLVDFWTPWCTPCQIMNPVLEQLSRTKSVRLVKVNLDEYPDLCSLLDIQAIPTLILVKDGAEIDRNVGLIPYIKLQEWILEHQRS